MMETIKLHDKEFITFLTSEQIADRVFELAKQINEEFQIENHLQRPIFLGVLDGSFRFLADLLYVVDIECGMSFLKLSSYDGIETTGQINQLIGIKENLEDRTIIVVEDIVDTGITIEYVVEELEKYNPKEIKVMTLLFKPDSYTKKIPIDYIGFEIPNDFVVGYGLDYDGLGRNLNDIYKLKENGN